MTKSAQIKRGVFKMKCQDCKNDFPKGYKFALFETKRVCKRCFNRLRVKAKQKRLGVKCNMVGLI